MTRMMLQLLVWFYIVAILVYVQTFQIPHADFVFRHGCYFGLKKETDFVVLIRNETAFRLEQWKQAHVNDLYEKEERPILF